MKEEINLLPPNVKTARHRRVLLRHLDRLGRRVIMAMTFIWLAIGIVFAVTLQERRLVESELHSNGGAPSDLAAEVREVNLLMRAVEQRVDAHVSWTPHVQEVISRWPGQARIEQLAVSAERDALVLEGVSQSRAAVLTLQADLEALPWVVRLDAPLQNFAAGRDNRFSFTLFRSEVDDATEE